jgi:hypothetical protein
MKKLLIGLAAGGLLSVTIAGGAFAQVAPPGETQFYNVGAECGITFPNGSGIFGAFQGTAIPGEGSIVSYSFVASALTAGIPFGSEIGTANSSYCGN